MVMTVLEARVKQENWPVLEAAYAEAVRELDPVELSSLW